MLYLQTRENFADLINLLKLKVGAEIGVRRGNFSELILSRTNMSKWYAIDPWDMAPEEGASKKDEEECRLRMSNFPNSEVMKFNSVEASKMFADKTVDFVYIDACHQYQYVLDDMNSWWPKITDNGIMAGHDYDEGAWPGVVRAVKEFVDNNNLKLCITGIGSQYGNDGGDGSRPSWWIQK